MAPLSQIASVILFLGGIMASPTGNNCEQVTPYVLTVSHSPPVKENVLLTYTPVQRHWLECLSYLESCVPAYPLQTTEVLGPRSQVRRRGAGPQPPRERVPGVRHHHHSLDTGKPVDHQRLQRIKGEEL